MWHTFSTLNIYHVLAIHLALTTKCVGDWVAFFPSIYYFKKKIQPNIDIQKTLYKTRLLVYMVYIYHLCSISCAQNPHWHCTSKNMKVAKCTPSREWIWCFVYMREHLSVWNIYIKRKSFWKHTQSAPPMWTEGSFTWPNGSDSDGVEEKARQLACTGFYDLQHHSQCALGHIKKGISK